MKMIRVAMALACCGAWVPVLAAEPYQMKNCTVHDKSISLSFASQSEGARLMVMGPSGVQLSGNIKGAARLDQVKELRVTPSGSLVLLFTSGSSNMELGPIDEACRGKLKQVAKPLGIKVVQIGRP